jgi:2'-5' RNA ligase
MENTKRTFIAVDIAPETRQLFAEISQNFRAWQKMVRFVNPESAHITLKFLGDTNINNLSLIVANLKEAIENFQAFHFECEHCGVFPNARHPRVLWLGITRGQEQLAQLSQKIDLALGTIGIEPETRPFKPHLTLARVKKFTQSLANLEDFLNYPYKTVCNNVDRVIFYESKLTPKGAIYKPIEIVRLGN